MRLEFERPGGAKEQYLKKLSQDTTIRQKYGDAAISAMSKGRVPEEMVVHHKMPLFLGGSNCFDNLILMSSPVHRENNKDLHCYEPGENPFGLEDM
ncbi:HNH endonuclease signature motif containing protein [Burkholderia paludis]|uniref:HNH endonuclease signature motif containing protein n=1 Tax=Burkholderia paludis TaxID=1506587 RepID=UPI0009470251|nr:HNH endonuclease signature motif containing protein [Burkholderia paludis]